MALKGMSTTLVIIVTAVVVLVTALVLLTIFGGSMTPIGSITQAQNQCALQAKQLCETTGALPPTWELNTMVVDGTPRSCAYFCRSGTGACDNKEWKSPCGTSPTIT